MSSTDRDQKMLWERYALYIDLYKYYFGATLKINAFFFGVAGAIVTYYFSNFENKAIALALYIPVVLGIAISVLYLFGIFTIGALEEDIDRVVQKMEIETKVTITGLYYLWWGSIVLFLLSSGAMWYVLRSGS